MAISYPNGIDSSLPTTITDSVATQTVHAGWHNDHNLAIIAIETELGTNPRGSYASVAARLTDSIQKTPGNGSQIIKPSLDERGLVLRPFSDTQTNKILEVQNAAGGAVLASIDKVGNADFPSYKVGGISLASTHLSDSASLARLASTNTFTVGQTISAAAGLTLSGAGSKTLLSITATTGNPGLTIGADTNLYRSAANTLATDDLLLFPQSLAATVVQQTTVAGVLTYQLKAGGTFEWANGTGAVDTNWYRRGVSLVGTDYTVDVNLEIVARSGAAAQVKIGALGPSSEAALQLGNATQFTLYKSGSNAATTTGTLSVGGLTTTGTLSGATINATSTLQVGGVALASTHLTDSSSLARLASPALTGVPTAPTAAVDTSTTQIATTAFVINQGYAKLASPALTGTPTAPTASSVTNTTQVATTAFVQTAVGAIQTVPAGVTVPYSGTAAPSGWLLADGSAVSRTTYAALFAAIGTNHGAGDGSTTFNLPDLQGRVAVGKAGAGGHADVTTLGATEGSALASRRPKHSHGLGTIAIGASGAHGHTFTGSGGTTGSGSPHSHGISGNGNIYDLPGSNYNAVQENFQAGNNDKTQGSVPSVISVNNESAHTHNFTPAGSISSGDTHTHPTGSFTGVVGTTTSAPAESPAYIVLNYIIKT